MAAGRTRTYPGLSQVLRCQQVLDSESVPAGDSVPRACHGHSVGQGGNCWGKLLRVERIGGSGSIKKVPPGDRKQVGISSSSGCLDPVCFGHVT